MGNQLGHLCIADLPSAMLVPKRKEMDSLGQAFVDEFFLIVVGKVGNRHTNASRLVFIFQNIRILVKSHVLESIICKNFEDKLLKIIVFFQYSEGESVNHSDFLFSVDTPMADVDTQTFMRNLKFLQVLTFDKLLLQQNQSFLGREPSASNGQCVSFSVVSE